MIIKAILFASTLAIAVNTPIIEVVDGDTLDIGETRVRIANIDTPEVWPGQYKCESELELGLKASERLREIVRNKVITYDGSRLDRYGRTVATVQADGQDVGETMIAEGYAVRWEGRRHKWCE